MSAKRIDDSIKFRKMIRDNGFTLVRCKGSHFIYKRDGEEIVVNKNINPMVARRLIKQHHLV